MFSEFIGYAPDKNPIKNPNKSLSLKSLFNSLSLCISFLKIDKLFPYFNAIL